MRKVLLLLFVFVYFKSFEQCTPMTANCYQYKKIVLDSSLKLPTDTLKSANQYSIANKGGAIYIKGASYWSKLIDTVNAVATKYYVDSVIYDNTFDLVPYTGAVLDVDLGSNNLSAKSLSVTGTAGNGHLHLKHQSSDAAGTGSSTTLFANSNGWLKWKNAGDYYSTLKMSQTADRVYTFQNKSYTLADSTTLADSVAALRAAVSANTGTVTSVATGYGLSGGTITTLGTLIADSSVLVTKSSNQTITGVKTVNPIVSGSDASVININGSVTATAHDQRLYGIKGGTTFSYGAGTYRNNIRALYIPNDNTELIYTNRNSVNAYSASASDSASLILNRVTSGAPMNFLFAYNGSTYGGIRANYSSGEIRFGGFTTGGYFATLYANNAEVMRATSGAVGIGVTSPTAILHLKAGTSTANTAPLKFNSGTNMSTAENGAVEYDGTDYFATAQSTRQTIFKGRSGSYSSVGSSTTTFTVTIGNTQPNSTYKVNVTPTASLSAALFYVSNKTTTTFDVVYLSGLTGTVTFDWTVIQ